MNILRLVARPLLALPFIATGVSAIRNPDEHVERIEPARPLLDKTGLTLSDGQLKLATRALGGVTAVAGVSLALGKATRTSAAVLALTSIPLALVNNPVWTEGTPDQRAAWRNGLVKDFALFGGLVIASTDREGRPSATWKLRNWADHRSELRAARSQAWDDASEVYQA
ncbi:MAG: DoxX family protein [Actinomyces sp.]|nr:DoxX family protein [Actinomyces sp.]